MSQFGKNVFIRLVSFIEEIAFCYQKALCKDVKNGYLQMINDGGM